MLSNRSSSLMDRLSRMNIPGPLLFHRNVPVPRSIFNCTEGLPKHLEVLRKLYFGVSSRVSGQRAPEQSWRTGRSADPRLGRLVLGTPAVFRLQGEMDVTQQLIAIDGLAEEARGPRGERP